MPVFGVRFSEEPLDFPTLFGRTAPAILEIGFGMGATTAEIAAAHPGQDYLGVEVHTPGVGALLKLVQAHALTNLRIIEHDVQAVVDFQIPDQTLTGIHVFFPDPWPKARHHKRRLIQQHFVTKLATKLQPGGYLHLATDWPDYAEQMIAAVNAVPAFTQPRASRSPVAGEHGVGSSPAPRPLTRFEQRGLKLGHPIADIMRIKIGR